MKISDIKITEFNFMGDHIMFEALFVEEVSGIAKPVDDDSKPEFGKVLQVGNGKLLDNGNRHPMTVKKGDIILFQRYLTDVVRHQGKDYYLIREEDIIGTK